MARKPEYVRPRFSRPDFLILGLGNPGARYEGTRHNFGFRVVDALAARASVALRSGPGPYHVAYFVEGSEEGLLAKPTTYVNRSGLAAALLLERFSGPILSRFLVVADDLDLPLGRIRFRAGGGNGGHNGLKSLIEQLGTQEFPRLRLGIGRPEGPHGPGQVIDHVLEPFHAEESDLVSEVVNRAVRGVRFFISSGIESAMNEFNAG